jgi:nicotinamide-nucleotide amidase
LATALLDRLRAKKLKLATAESCTGGLIGATLTAIAGSSDVFERGFVTYTNEAKAELLGVPPAVIERHGAVSEPVALLMAKGALARSRAEMAISVTGIAGPGGGSADKPVGLVYMAAASRAGPAVCRRFVFSGLERNGVRAETVRAALNLVAELAEG